MVAAAWLVTELLLFSDVTQSALNRLDPTPRERRPVGTRRYQVMPWYGKPCWRLRPGMRARSTTV
jgi:hypothetical protein